MGLGTLLVFWKQMLLRFGTTILACVSLHILRCEFSHFLPSSEISSFCLTLLLWSGSVYQRQSMASIFTRKQYCLGMVAELPSSQEVGKTHLHLKVDAGGMM